MSGGSLYMPVTFSPYIQADFDEDEFNSLTELASPGARGTLFGPAQMTGMLGQQFVRANRIIESPPMANEDIVLPKELSFPQKSYEMLLRQLYNLP